MEFVHYTRTEGPKRPSIEEKLKVFNQPIIDITPSETTTTTETTSTSTAPGLSSSFQGWKSSGSSSTSSSTSSPTSTSTVSTSTSSVDPNRTVRFMGKDVNLKDAVGIITKNLSITANNPEFLHTCTRHVANALKGVTNPRQYSGVKGPSEMHLQLTKDGWQDVLSDNYTPQIGDVYLVWGATGGKYGMHTSMWNGSLWLSYNADNHGKSTPWYFLQRGKQGVNMHIMRYGPQVAKNGGILKTLILHCNKLRNLVKYGVN